MKLQNSFIPAKGIGKKTEQKLWKNNVTHWDEAEDSNVLSQNRTEKLRSFIEKARKNLEVGNTVFFKDKLPSKEKWRLYKNFREEACFFDIETTGLKPERHKLTTVSFHRGGEDITLVQGQDLTAERVKEELFNSKVIVSFNGKRFDQPFLEKRLGIEIETPHIDLMYPAKRLGFSGGLKKIEKELKIQRELEDIDGREAIRLWKRYDRKDDQEALEKLVKYNRYDARNLKDVLEEVHRRLTSQVFEPHVPR